MSAGENFKFIFREAKINDAILFFDECEAIFETREKGGHDVNTLLTEIERFVPCTVLAYPTFQGFEIFWYQSCDVCASISEMVAA